MKKHDDYDVLDFGTSLIPGAQIKIEHSVSSEKADLSDLISRSAEDLQAMREEVPPVSRRLMKSFWPLSISGKNKRLLPSALTGRFSISVFRQLSTHQMSGCRVKMEKKPSAIWFTR